MNKRWTEHFKADLPTFYDATRKFYAKELKPAEYKGVSGGFGCYGERGGETTMIRLRFTGGILEREDLIQLREAIKKYNLKFVHFTTCQSVQFHHLKENQILGLMKDCYEQGILTRGAGSDFPRNITAPALRGVDPLEYFDITELVKEAADYLLSFIGVVGLPRKLKVSFNNTGTNAPHTTVRDLGFVGRPDGLFDIYAAGGLGPNPRLGVLIESGVCRERVLYYIHAMYMLFSETGDYKNRARNRTRYFQTTLGANEFRKLFHTYLEKASSLDLTVKSKEKEVEKNGCSGDIIHPCVHRQKQEGLYYVEYHPQGGTPTIDEFTELISAIIDINGAQLRLGAEETAYITNLTAREAETIAGIIENHTARTSFEKSVSCVGCTICQIGLRDSAGLLRDILSAVEPYHFAEGVLPRLYISGCPNSCGTHELASMGFMGGAKRVNGETVPAFVLFTGGSEDLGKEKLGKERGVLSAIDIPQFIVDLGKSVEATKSTFAAWQVEHADEFQQLIDKYV